MNEPISQPIPPLEAQEAMRNDIVALVSRDPYCPLAKKIADFLLVVEHWNEAHAIQPPTPR